MPIVKPLNLREIVNPCIAQMLIREQNSCQHFSIVSTPKALKQGAKFNLEKEQKIMERRAEEKENFNKSRKKINQEKQDMWLQVKAEYCQDFETEKAKIQKERIRANLRRFCKSFLEQFEILTHKMKMNPLYLRENKLFPNNPFEKGDCVRIFLKHVKSNNLKAVDKMLQNDPMLVFEYDEMNQSGLIWAAKRGHNLMVRMLCKYHSRVNFRDLPGRTALHFAV